MQPTRRALLVASLMATPPALADASSRALASYYERHMALLDGVAHGWIGRGTPRPLLDDVQQVGVGKHTWFALRRDGTLLRWADAAHNASTLMRGVTRFAAGDSGWFAIDGDGVLWHGGDAPATRIAASVVDACIGDGADYFVQRDGTLQVRGLAHRGQHGDGELRARPGFVVTAHDAVAVRAHTGHALYLRRDGVVLGTGGNRFGPLSSHGLGDMAARWGPIFDAAVALATGSRHSVAIRADASLWAWGHGFEIAPRRILKQVVATAAGDSATLALTRDGALWQWDGGGAARHLLPA